jgi:hypothetical protein
MRPLTIRLEIEHLERGLIEFKGALYADAIEKA